MGLIRRLLQSADNSELLVCKSGVVHKESGLQGFDHYRRAAFREQHERAEKAARAAEQRLQMSRQERKERPCRRRSSMSAASTREPTPDGHFVVVAQPPQQPPGSHSLTLEAFFKKKGKKKPKPTQFGAYSR